MATLVERLRLVYSRGGPASCWEAAERIAELEGALGKWRGHNGCSPTPDGVYIMVPAQAIDELLNRK